MKRKNWFIVLLILLALLLQPAPFAAQPVEAETPPPDFKAGELLVSFNEGVVTASAAQIRSQHQATLRRTLLDESIQLWEVPEGQELAAAKALSADPAVAFAEPNYIYHAFTTPNDPNYSKQWAHTKVNAPAAWDINTGSSDVIIAIIDSGIDENHPDLSGKIISGYDYVDNDSNPHDLNGHGTHVAGIAAAATNNGTGVAGASWGARIMPVRVLNFEGRGSTSDIADGITWAYTHGADILNLSLGGDGYSEAMQTAINSAHSAGALVLAAMGNCREYDPPYCEVANPTSYPAANANVMAVAATAPDDTYANYSQYGSHCDIAAPGGEMYSIHDTNGIYSTMPTYNVYMNNLSPSYSNNYDYVNGTSQATPYVAGLAALVWSEAPALSPDEVQAVIQNTAVDLGSTGWDSTYGHGRVNAQAAVAAVSGPDAPTLNAISNADGDGSYTVDWDAVSGAASYQLQEDDSSAFSSPTVRYTGSSTQYAVSGQSVGTWYYRVRGSDGSKYGQWSTTRSVDVNPSAPALDAISNPGQDDAYSISWSAVSGATGYVLQQADNASFTGAVTRYSGTATSYSVTGQRDGTWYYRVKAVHNTLQGDWSNTATTTVAPAPHSAPLLSAIDNSDGDGSYQVSWSAVSGVLTSYTLEESRTPYFEDPDVAYSGSALYVDITDHAGGTWYYRVRASDFEGSSPWSLTKSVDVQSRIFLPLVMRNYAVAGPLQNGDFESGATNWTESSSNGYALILHQDSLPPQPHGGSWAVWLGGDNNESGTIEQLVIVPTSAPYLAYWYWIASEDICDFDYGGVKINGVDVDKYTLCEDNTMSGWGKRVINLSAYAGQGVTLRLWIDTDSSLNSNLFIDDVAFQSSAASEPLSAPAAGQTNDVPFKARR